MCWGSNTSNNSPDNTLLDFLSDMNLQQLIDEPTHRCGIILDLVFCVDDLDCNVIRSGHQLSDHYPVTFSLSKDTPSRPPVLCFSRSQFDDNLFAFNLSNLYSYIFSTIVHCASFCHDWQLLFSQALDLSLPRKRRKRVDSPYYYSSHTMHVANQKNTADRALQKAWSLPAVLKCRSLANELTCSIDADKACLLDSLSSGDTRQCFKFLQLLSNSSPIPAVMQWNHREASCNASIASLFNDYFCSVYKPAVTQRLGSATDTLTPICLDDLTISVDGIENLLQSCDDSSAHGCDNIPSFVLRNCSRFISTAVYYLFLHILSVAEWPEFWKTSHVTPLLKSGARRLVVNYRPISILPKLFLVLERLIFNFVYPRIRHKISRQQFGFMTQRSTVTQLIAYLHLLYINLDGNIPTSVVYFDIKKAFDSVPHSEILMKLSKFGFDERFTLLFQSYLENRHQVVKVVNHLSDRKPVSSGVPQGSVLGPLLFVIYLNDICDCIQNSDYFLFADDLKISNSTSSADVQADISSLHQWTTLNGLEFHNDKTKLLLQL